MTPVDQKSRCKEARGRLTIKKRKRKICLINYEEYETVTIDSCRPAEPEQRKTSEPIGSYPSVSYLIFDWLVCSRKEQRILHTHWNLSFLRNVLHHPGNGWTHGLARNTTARRTRKWVVGYGLWASSRLNIQLFYFLFSVLLSPSGIRASTYSVFLVIPFRWFFEPCISVPFCPPVSLHLPIFSFCFLAL